MLILSDINSNCLSW